jgi:hypothetical protein
MNGEQAPLVGAICSQCERTEELVACIACGKTVCGWHRMGLGSVSDGYACSMRCSLSGFREVPVPRTDISQIRERKPHKSIALDVGLLILLACVVFMLAAILSW